MSLDKYPEDLNAVFGGSEAPDIPGTAFSSIGEVIMLASENSFAENPSHIQLAIDTIKRAQSHYANTLGLHEESAGRLAVALLEFNQAVPEPLDHDGITTLLLRKTHEKPVAIKDLDNSAVLSFMQSILEARGETVLVPDDRALAPLTLKNFPNIRLKGWSTGGGYHDDAQRYYVSEIKGDSIAETEVYVRAIFELGEQPDSSWYCQVGPFTSTGLRDLNSLDPKERIHWLAGQEVTRLDYGVGNE